MRSIDIDMDIDIDVGKSVSIGATLGAGVIGPWEMGHKSVWRGGSTVVFTIIQNPNHVRLPDKLFLEKSTRRNLPFVPMHHDFPQKELDMIDNCL